MFHHVILQTVIILSCITIAKSNVAATKTTISTTTSSCFVGAPWHIKCTTTTTATRINTFSSLRQSTRSNGGRNYNECKITSTKYDNDHDDLNTMKQAITTQKQQQSCHESPSPITKSRREALFQITATTTTASALLMAAQPANAGLPEIDTKSGELFSPKQQMMGGGGSTAARGISLQSRDFSGRKERGIFNSNQPIQSVYETRFIVYLSRFLLNFDPAASAWWKEGLKKIENDDATSKKQKQSNNSNNAAINLQFAEFAESVEIGLADYFVGPYGSYASVQAAKAGINAVAPATSSTVPSSKTTDLPRLSDIFGKWFEKPPFGDRIIGNSGSKVNNGNGSSKQKEVMKSEKQGILNLYALLKARYTSIEAKEQLAILFSMISSPSLQPIAEIKGLLGEIDNATIKSIDLIVPSSDEDDEITPTALKKIEYRSSSRKGGGYSITNPPNVFVEPPPALGDDYVPAKGVAVMKPTTRILRVNVTDGGEGYTSAPTVSVVQNNGIVRRQCSACAIMDRYGRVESIIVLDPGLGYGGSTGRRGEVTVPTVNISPPKRKRSKKTTTRDGNNNQKKTPPTKLRPAKAVAELEYEVVGVDIVGGGSGYVLTQPPSVYVTPSEDDPDWFVPRMKWDTMKQENNEGNGKDGSGYLKGQVTAMQYGAEKSVVDTSEIASTVGDKSESVGADILLSLYDDPIGLLPSNVRPVLAVGDPSATAETTGYYKIPSLPPVPTTNIPLPSPRYRTIDPIFGGIAKAPVTKGAMSLSVSEYSRLALSGAVCTVIVRTLLNPLELIKTKIQLKNDIELNEFALQRAKSSISKKGGDKAKDTARRHHSTPSKVDDESGVKRQSREKSLILATSQSASEDDELERKQAASLKTAEKVAMVGRKRDTLSTEEDIVADHENETEQLGTMAMISSLVELRGPLALFQSADITFLASLVFGSFGFGATELFRRSFSSVFFEDSGGKSGFGSELVLLAAAALATVITSAAATPFETIRVRSMGIIESKGWKVVLGEFLDEKRKARNAMKAKAKNISELEELLPSKERFRLRDLRRDDAGPLMAGFSPIVSRELPFAITKFLVFDLVATAVVALINSQPDMVEQVQVGVGATGLAVSAASGALAGIAGAFVSHPADLILTLQSASKNEKTSDSDSTDSKENSDDGSSQDWRPILKEILEKEGGALNLFAGFPARATFFFLVIGLQFFLYDFVKGIFSVGSEDLQLVLDVFYAIRQGLVNMDV